MSVQSNGFDILCFILLEKLTQLFAGISTLFFGLGVEEEDYWRQYFVGIE